MKAKKSKMKPRVDKSGKSKTPPSGYTPHRPYNKNVVPTPYAKGKKDTVSK